MLKQTRVIPVDPEAPAAEAIAIAGRVIREGGLVAFPTETVYGLGANAFDEAAVAKIFAAKRRPPNDPLIVHIEQIEQLSQVARGVPPPARALARRYWPGPLTLVLKKAARLPGNLTAHRDTAAVRMPNHKVALALLRAAGGPIAAPSANLFSCPSPTSAQHVIDDLAGLVDVLLDGGRTPIGVESTIVSLLDERPRLLRPGGIAVEALRRQLPDLTYEPQFLADDDWTAPAPGTMLRHYSPKARVILFSGEDDRAVFAAMRAEIASHEQVGLLLCDADAEQFASLGLAIERLGANADDAAQRLFAALRSLDTQGVDCILARAPKRAGLGLALWDRLLRAAEGSLVAVSPAPAD